MAIGPIDMAMIQRTNDVEMYKLQEDAKPVVDQQNIQMQVNQRADVLSHQVIQSQNSDKTKNDADAREEGHGQYRASSSKRKKAAADKGRVIRKSDTFGFDIKI
ncbi:MAG: hypothetical protein MR943_00910 [Lachnobacterium sp.]|nr:hypothetical protein [Lachnobacterium sp.]